MGRPSYAPAASGRINVLVVVGQRLIVTETITSEDAPIGIVAPLRTVRAMRARIHERIDQTTEGRARELTDEDINVNMVDRTVERLAAGSTHGVEDVIADVGELREHAQGATPCLREVTSARRHCHREYDCSEQASITSSSRHFA
jgi:hypothetical protein